MPRAASLAIARRIAQVLLPCRTKTLTLSGPFDEIGVRAEPVRLQNVAARVTRQAHEGAAPSKSGEAKENKAATRKPVKHLQDDDRLAPRPALLRRRLGQRHGH
jgi:hypothetical protein